MAFKLNVEIVSLLIFFALNFSGTITGDYVIYTTCYVTLGYNQTICALLGTNNTNNETAKLEAEVQPFATRITTTSAVIDATFAPLLCFFLGSWSDKFGRKPVMLLGIAGSAGSYLIKCIISSIPGVSPWFMLISSLPSSITGGISATITVMLCYIADTTTNQERGIKLFIFEGTVGLGMVVSALTCTLALDALGYPAVFFISFVCAVLSWIFVFICIPESVENPENENKFRRLFNIELLISTIKTVFKPRDHYERGILLTTFALLALTVFSYFGVTSVLFLYLRNKFSWSLGQCTFYTSVMSVVSIVGGTIGIALFYKVLQFKEASIILLSLFTCLIATMFQGSAKTTFEFYISGSFNLLSSTVSPMGRNIISKIIEVENVGKVFSILITIEAMFALGGNLFYTFIYNNTLTTLPSAFYFLTSGFYGVNIILLGVILLFQRYTNQLIYVDVSEESIN
ncbi:hypothetical protein RN001_001570 [Aquatica leii]|uniref:Major facilitator superfamily (MFS) profile domain-containing protein n=1 Tax=Aquatica leii TaxID=1421715 RepID=A0AAN7SLB4_9COLE|nr:hypothetical protein RN001_001570 [Aquatica leii]